MAQSKSQDGKKTESDMRSLEMIIDVCEKYNIKASIQGATLDGAIIGASAFTGGLLGALPGAAIGGAVGWGAAYAYSKYRGESYKSLREVVMNEMSPERRLELLNDIVWLIATIGVENLPQARSALLANRDLLKPFLEKLDDFLRKYTSMKLSQ